MKNLTFKNLKNLHLLARNRSEKMFNDAFINHAAGTSNNFIKEYNAANKMFMLRVRLFKEITKR